MHIIAGQHTPIIAGQSQWSKIGAPMQQIDIVRKNIPTPDKHMARKTRKLRSNNKGVTQNPLRGTKKERKKPFPGSAALGGIVSSAFPAPLVFHHRMTQSKTERTTPVNPYERSYPLLSSKRKSAVISKSCHGTSGNMRRQRISEQKRLTLILSL